MLLIPQFLFAADNILSASSATDGEPFKSRANHWIFNMGFEGMEYQLPFAYDGTKTDFKEENRALFGARMGLGREYYLGAGFLIGARLDGYYLGTLFTKEKTARYKNIW